jgi:hypothetical protein
VNQANGKVNSFTGKKQYVAIIASRNSIRYDSTIQRLGAICCRRFFVMDYTPASQPANR